ncbi:ankyrin repeat, bromo and BTB domain-containing protein DDB_G0293800-like [Gambusia affinis]|uniref:ankyrin repeat, bromo and BTB domain-containing protein DDB_G0293800-like n=1 Tax=Gambusia affinis TaxID=33528 RepID=UPI001CDCE76D|nr:ankyrin repeat, bromo and BTB domain-containing protein DDB_G0293800-like [Gambusia affinis]
MELPADGSPMLEGLPDNGKEDGKLWLNGANMVSEDHGEELRYSSPPQSEDCSTSSTGNSSTNSTGSSSTNSTGSSSTNSTGSSSTSSTGSSSTSSTGSSSTSSTGSSSTSSTGSSSTSSTGSSSTSSTGSSSTSSTGSSSTSSTGSSSTSSSEGEVGNGDQDFGSRFRVVQVLQPNIKFLWGIGVLEEALKRLKSTVDQLGSGDSSPVVLADVASKLPEILPHNFKYIQDIGVAQKPQEDLAPCTSLEFPSGLDKQEEPILRPETSSPIGTLQHPQVGLEEDRASLTSSPAGRTTKKVEAVKDDDPPSQPSHQVGLKEDAAHVTSVTGINGKRTKNSDDEEQPPAKRSRQTFTELELAIKSIVQSFPSQEMEYEDPVVLPPVLCLSPLMSCEDPGLSSPILSPSCKIACKSPVFSSPVLSPSTLTHCEDPILSPSVFGLLPWMPCEDPILSPLVSPSTHFPNSNCSSPDFFFGMDTEEEAIPSTSSGITARESSRHLWFRPHYDLSSDSN